MKDAVGRTTQSVHLQLDEIGRELANKVVKDNAHCGVMAQVHVGLIDGLLLILVLAALMILTLLRNHILQEG